MGGVRARAPFTREVAAALSSRWATLGCAVASGIVVGRALGPGQKGTFVLTFLLMNQLVSVGTLGLPQALVYFTASGRLSRAEAVGHFLCVSVMGALLLMVPYAAIVHWGGPRLFRGVSPESLYAVGLLLLPALLVTNGLGLLRGLGRLDLFNRLRLVEAGLALLAVLVALVVLGRGVGATVAASAVAQTTAGLVALGLVLAAAGSGPRWSPRSLGPLLAYGAKSSLSLTLQMTERKIDLFLLGWILSAETAAWQIGLYSVAVSLAELPRHLAGAVSTVLLPRISAADTRANAERVPRVARHLVAGSVAFAAVLAVLAWPAIGLLYGRAFLGAYLPFVLLLPGVVMAGVWNVFETELLGSGRPLRLSLFAGLTLVLNVALNLVAIPRWGIAGAAASSGVTYALLAVCLIADYRARHREVAVRDLLIVSRSDLARSLMAVRNGR